jgi:CHAD domain-containing protein
MRGSLVYLLSAQHDCHQLLQRIGDIYLLQEAGETTTEESCLDTFDWRLFNQGLFLNRKGIHCSLLNSSGEELFSGGGGSKQNRFWWDFPDTVLQALLREVIDVRALLVQFSISTSRKSWAILNKDEKTVLRLTLVNTGATRGDEHYLLMPVLIVEPLKGYKNAQKKVCDLLEAVGLQRYADTYSPLSELHTLAAIDPKENDSKFEVNLTREDTIVQSVRDIGLVLLAAMQRNLQGILDDIDSEFLHDLRVSVRRIRSLLSLLKKWLPPEEVVRFQAEFKWLGTVTGGIRDLDVYLLKRDVFKAILPEELQPGLDCFFQDIIRQRKRKLRTLREQLRSERFTGLLSAWEQFLRHLPEQDLYSEGQKNCHEVAEKIIRKRFKRILRYGEAITPATPDGKLHELRIEGKKFRYLLEFYRSLFQNEAVDSYLKQLKKLQNNLGDFNDFTVQKHMLVQKLAGIKADAPQAIETAAALGGLIVHLGETQQLVRTRFEKTFQDFATAENIELLESICTVIDGDATSPGSTSLESDPV